MKDFIDAGLWRTRKTGRELNFGQDKFEITRNGFTPIIDVFLGNINWIPWAKTIGSLTQINEQEYLISFREKIYKIYIEKGEGKLKFTLLNCESSKNDIKFQSLFRSVIIKSIYCVACGVCEAECKNKCIDMKNGIHINDSCIHCYKCHDIYGHCLRYNSIRNKVTEGKKMEGLDRYYSFGVRQNWMNIFIKYQGSPEFWENDGDGEVPNKKKEAFLNFVKDANIVEYNKLKSGNKFTKCTPTKFGETIFKLGSDSNIAWALILVNLAYTPTYRWLIKNLDMNIGYTPDSLKLMLGDVMGDGIKGKGLGKRNVVDAFKITMCKTPLGIQKIFGDPDYSVKVAASGQETITLNSFRRTNWQDPEPLVILYSLYKFSEACDDYNQFTLSRLLNHEVESNGLSPTQIFGIDRNNMEKILNGLSINYPDFINTSFTLDLDNINLMKDKSSEDVLSLF
jgi:phosphoadenosine phosphosulfate reductase